MSSSLPWLVLGTLGIMRLLIRRARRIGVRMISQLPCILQVPCCSDVCNNPFVFNHIIELIKILISPRLQSLPLKNPLSPMRARPRNAKINQQSILVIISAYIPRVNSHSPQSLEMSKHRRWLPNTDVRIDELLD